MSIGIGLIGLFGIIWIWTLLRLFEEQTLPRIFAVMMFGILMYLSFELTMWSMQTPLVRMLVIGSLPLVLVITGFTIYDRRYKLENAKAKNDEKSKLNNPTTGEAA